MDHRKSWLWYKFCPQNALICSCIFTHHCLMTITDWQVAIKCSHKSHTTFQQGRICESPSLQFWPNAGSHWQLQNGQFAVSQGDLVNKTYQDWAEGAEGRGGPALCVVRPCKSCLCAVWAAPHVKSCVVCSCGAICINRAGQRS